MNCLTILVALQWNIALACSHSSSSSSSVSADEDSRTARYVCRRGLNNICANIQKCLVPKIYSVDDNLGCRYKWTWRVEATGQPSTPPWKNPRRWRRQDLQSCCSSLGKKEDACLGLAMRQEETTSMAPGAMNSLTCFKMIFPVDVHQPVSDVVHHDKSWCLVTMLKCWPSKIVQHRWNCWSVCNHQ